LDVHGTNVIYVKGKSGQNNETPLEPNHTQFILIDDGTKHQYGGEFAFRARFEKAISGESFTLENNLQDSSDSVPVVLLVIDGGRDTIKKGFPLFD
jgi:transient receptor potential cation channel subfamily M protein 2